MTNEERGKLVDMLSSADEEMRDLGMTVFETKVITKDDYTSFHNFSRYEEIPSWIRRYIRSIFINSHGKLRMKYKKW